MFKFINKLKNRKGFTLIELIVVLAVLAIIMAIAVPRFLGVQEQAKDDADLQTIQMIAKGAEMYFVKNTTATSVAPSVLISSGYIESIKFNDETAYGVAGADLTISYNTATGSVTIKDTTTPATIYYPK